MGVSWGIFVGKSFSWEMLPEIAIVARELMNGVFEFVRIVFDFRSALLRCSAVVLALLGRGLMNGGGIGIPEWWRYCSVDGVRELVP